jgi:bacterioferritin-associated ferredoxin
VYVCNCFGVTEAQVKKHAEGGACTPRQIASACKAGTDCGSCVRRIQALLGRGACPGASWPTRACPCSPKWKAAGRGGLAVSLLGAQLSGCSICCAM